MKKSNLISSSDDKFDGNRNGGKVTDKFTIRKGIKCFVHHWKPSVGAIKALVVIFHGFGAHGNYPTVRYAAEFLVDSGYAVVAIDFPGHGQSDGIRGYVESPETVIADGFAMVQYAQSLYDDKKQKKNLFLLGSSMGGSIALLVSNALSSSDTFVAGVVLLAPMLQLKVSYMERFFLSGLAYIVPTIPLIPTSATSNEKQYRDADKRQECQNDKLTYKGKLRPRSAYTLVNITSQLQEKFALIRTPLLIMVADDDVVVQNEGSEKLYNQSSSCTDKTKKHYPALHGLLCEPSPLFDEIKQDLLSWMDDRAT